MKLWYYDPKSQMVRTQGTEEPICTVGCAANGPLVAAAPLMLEALEYLAHVCVECSEGRMTDAEALTRASVRAQAAIRAAKRG